jgi:hypothetical protein
VQTRQSTVQLLGTSSYYCTTGAAPSKVEGKNDLKLSQPTHHKQALHTAALGMRLACAWHALGMRLACAWHAQACRTDVYNLKGRLQLYAATDHIPCTKHDCHVRHELHQVSHPTLLCMSMHDCCIGSFAICQKARNTRLSPLLPLL